MTAFRGGSVGSSWVQGLRARWGVLRWPVIGALWAGALALGYVGFRAQGDAAKEARTWRDNAYFTLQLITIQSGSVPGDVPWSLEVARWMCPIVAAFTAVEAMAVIFHEQFRLLRLRRMKGHVVVCGMGRKGLQLIRDSLDVGEPVVAIEWDADHEEIGDCLDRGAIVLRGNATDRQVLRKARVARAKHLIAASGNDGTNVEIALRAYPIVDAAARGDVGAVKCHVHIVDVKLCSLFKRHRIFTDTRDALDVRVFNVYENSARLLFEEHALERDGSAAEDERRVHLVVVGFGQMGESVALQAARIGHFANGKRLRLTVIDRDANAKANVFYTHYPQFDRTCDVSFVQGDIEDRQVLQHAAEWANEGESLMSVAICFDGDPRALSCALSLSLRFQEAHTPIYVRIGQEAGLADLLQGERSRPQWAGCVYAFGAPSLTSSRKLLLNEELDLLAKEIYEDHLRCALRNGSSGTPTADPGLPPWDQLDEDERDANRQQADHIPVKLRAIGCLSVLLGEAGVALSEFSVSEVELLTRMEHARWLAERFLAGWTHAPGPADTTRSTHPDLVAWDQLSPGAKEAEREAVRRIPRLVGLVGRKVCRRG